MSDFTYEPIGPVAETKPTDTPPDFTYEPVGAAQGDLSSFMPDPEKAKQGAAVNAITQQATGLPQYTVEALAKSDPLAVSNWAGGLAFADKQRQIDALSFKQALGDKSPETVEEIKALQAEQAKDPKANFLQGLISGAGEQGAAGLRAAGMWMLGALTWPYRKAAELTGIQALKDNQEKTLSEIGANFGLSKERTAALTGNPVTSLGETAKEATAGITGPTYRTLVDQGVDPEIASAASFVLGGALTAMQLIPAGRLIPGAQRIGEASFKAAVIALAQNGGLTALAKLWGTRVLTIGAEQAALGMMNATTQVLGEEWARQYSNATKGTKIPPTPFADLAKDVLVIAGTQAAVGTAIGGIVAAKEIRPAYEMGAKLRSYVDDVRAARATNVTAGMPPEPAQKALPLPETKAPLEQARVLLEQPPAERNPQVVAETQTQLDAAVKQITDNPAPETIPQAIEAAKASDAIETVTTQSAISLETQASAPQEYPINAVDPSELPWSGLGKVSPDYKTNVSEGGHLSEEKIVDISSLVDTENTVPSQVEDIKRIIQSDIDLPPIVVERDADGLFVVDGHHRLQAAKELGYTKIPIREYINAPDNTIPEVSQQIEQSVKAGIPVPDAQLPIDQPWALSEMELRNDARDTAIEMYDAGDAVDAQEFAELMKSSELPGAEKPSAWYESQWDNMEKQRLYIESAKNDEFLGTLAKDDLQATLKEIADNPEAVSSKALAPWLEKAKAGMSEGDFQSFVTEAAKNPAKWRKAIEQGMDPEARQAMQDRVAEGMASKVTRQLASDELLAKYSDIRIGELTTSSDPEQQKAAALVAKLLKAAMKDPSSAIDYESRVTIQEMQDSVSLESGPRLRVVRDRLRTYYEQHPETPPDAETTALLNQKLSGDMKVKDLRDLAEQIDAERFKGKAIQDVKRVKERTLIDGFKDRLMDDIQMGRGWKKNLDEPVIPPKGMEAFQKVKGAGSKQAEKTLKGNVWQRQAANTLSPQRIFRFLGPSGERAWDMMNESRTNEWRSNDDLLEPAVTKSKELGITARTLARKITTKDGTLEYTVDDVLAMRWAHDDPNSQETLLYGNNITPEQYDDLTSQLREPEKLWGDYMQSVFGGDNYNRLAQAYVEEMNRRPPPKVDKYFPIRIQDKQYDSPGSEISEDMASRSGLRSARPNKRFMIARKNVKPENRQRMRLGATALFFEQVAKQEHYINTWQTAKRLKKIFMADAKVREQIAQMFGDDWNKAIGSAISNFANPNGLRATTPGDHFANAMRHGLTSSGLLGNLVTVGYNLTGPLTYLGDAGPRYLLSGLAQWVANPKAVYDEVTTNVPLIKHASMDPVIQGLKNQAPNEYRSFMQLVEKIGYQPLEWVDMWTRVVGAKAVHDKGIDEGLSPKEAWNEALLATQRTQPSGEPSDLPMMYNAQSLKMFLAFTRQLNQIWNMYSADVPQAIKQGNFLKAVGDITAIALSGLLIAMMGQKSMPKDPKEAALWMLDQFVVSIPILGNQLEPFLIGKGYVGRGAEIIPGAQKVVQDIQALTGGRKPVSARIDAAIRVAIDATRFVGGPAVMLTRLYGMLHTGDPWELIGGPPKGR